MRVSQYICRPGEAGGEDLFRNFRRQPTDLVLVFGSATLLGDADIFRALRAACPEAVIVGCTTAGEIHGAHVSDETLVVTAIGFAQTRVRLAAREIADAAQSYPVGRALADGLAGEGLSYVLVLSDGLRVNGTELVRGLEEGLPPGIDVTGGLSADGEAFSRTLVRADDVVTEGIVAAVGFYGDRLRVGFGSVGGWDSFGPERLVTRAAGNVLFDLDGQSALALYKTYLGEHARDLPATGLLFPLQLRTQTGDGIVRTILGIGEEDQSMTFAGDIPQGSHARLMKANLERLIDGAADAARTCNESMNDATTEFALLISCVGRKLVLGQRAEEEIEGVREVLGAGIPIAGFYSYGEIAPHRSGAKCELHNQTMTITSFSER